MNRGHEPSGLNQNIARQFHGDAEFTVKSLHADDASLALDDHVGELHGKLDPVTDRESSPSLLQDAHAGRADILERGVFPHPFLTRLTNL